VPISFFYEDASKRADGARGFAEDDDSQSLMEFIASGEGLQLSMAFMRIKNAKARRTILDLVRALAEKDDEED
jgi:hypothetical protein